MSTDASTLDTPTPSGAVVAALDGSHRDDAVTAWAVAEAAALSAPLHLVHAVDLGTPLSAYGELLTSPEIVERVERDHRIADNVVAEAVVAADAARVFEHQRLSADAAGKEFHCRKGSRHKTRPRSRTGDHRR